jgi:hypothetical protein
MGWWSSLGCDSFGDKTYGDVKTSGDKAEGRIVRRQNVRGRIVPVPFSELQHHTVPDTWIILHELYVLP